MENQIPQEFLEEITAEHSLVHPDTPSEEEVVSVWTCDETQQKIRNVFDVAGLTLTQDTLDVILQDYKLSAAFLHDYSDLVNEDDKPAQIEDYYRVMDNAIQKILRYVQEYGDPHYDPLAKVMANFYSAISDADIKEMVGCLKATEAAKTQ